VNHRRRVVTHEMTSKPGAGFDLGMSQAGACLLVWRCPAYRWRELGSGFGMERENPSPGTVFGGLSPVAKGRVSSSEELRETEYRSPGRGTDRPVVVMKLL
jgi:hypothetical protein